MLMISPPEKGVLLLPGASAVEVIVFKHPLRSDAIRSRVDEGLSISEILADAWPERGERPCVAYLGEWVVPSELWPRVRPKHGTTLVFRAAMRGRGVTQALALVAIAVAALVAGPWIAAAIGLTGKALTVGGALITGAITLGGQLAINAMFPIAKKTNAANALAPNEDAPRTYSISGAQNQSKPFATVPLVLGRHRISPPYAAKPYTEIIGDDVYLRAMFCVGYGLLDIAEIKIGESPISAYSNCEVEVFYGSASDGGSTLFPSSVDQQDLSVDLLHAVENRRTTALDTDEISVDIAAPQGIYIVDTSTGERKALGVTVSVFYRLVGAGSFTKLGDLGFWRELGLARRATRWQVPRGQYEVMLYRQTPSVGGENTAEQVVWTALRSFTIESPVRFHAPVALIALRIKASDQLSGVIDTLNCVATSYAIAFNGTIWQYVDKTRNPADLFRHVLQSPSNKQTVADDGIDLAALEGWWRYCSAKGFTYDAVVEDATSVYERISRIATAGRAVPTFRDGKWSVVWDDFEAAIVQHFTPRNSSGFSSERVYQKTPHAFRVKFIDGGAGYASDERIVYDDGYDAANATLFESIEIDGITDKDLAWKHGRYHIAQARLRPEKYTIKTDFEHLRCTRGDRVRLSHDVIKVGLAYGRVKSVAGQSIVVDESIAMASGSYSIRFRLADGTSVLREVVTAAGETNTIDLSGTGTVPAPGDLFMFGETGRESIVCRVFSISPADDLAATLVLVDDAPDIANADTGVIPEFNSNISQPVDLYQLPPKNLSAKEVVLQGGTGAATAVIRLSWQGPPQGKVRSYEIQVRDEASGLTGSEGWGFSQTVLAPQTQADVVGLLLGHYSFRVRCAFDLDAVSDWATLPSSKITGSFLSSPTPDVTRLRSLYVDGVRTITWDEVRDFRAITYEIRKGSTWESALLVDRVAHPPFSVPGNDTYWVSATARPIAGLEVSSANPQSVSIQGAQLVRNVLATRDEQATGWTGTFQGAVAISGGIIRTGGSGNILDIPDMLSVESLLDYGGGGSGSYEIPAAHYVDAGRVTPCAVTCDILASASWGDQNILTEGDFLAIQDLLGAEAARYVEIFVEIALGANNPSDVYAPADIYSAADIYAQSIDWGAWQRFTPGVYNARHFKFRVVLNCLSNRAVAQVNNFSFTVDVPDRVDHYSNVVADPAVDPAGTTIVFWPDLGTEAAPFNGGPNEAAYPYVNATILNAQAGDLLVISGLSASQVTIQVTNGGTPVSRTLNVDAQGY